MHQHLNTLYQGQSLTRDAARDAFGQAFVAKWIPSSSPVS